jgi:hypothetical protein
MMANKQPVSVEEFLTACDPSGLLDEDETFDQYYTNAQQTDAETGIYRSTMDGEVVYFIQTAGFEMIFGNL